ncbi:TonB-dependent siderophore receptor [Nostoc sp. 3335mG]|nr:TonB-dependent siderophore receptor [Nostoc sp. 3335mG]
MSVSTKPAPSGAPAFLAIACVGAILTPAGAWAADPAAPSGDAPGAGTANAGEGGSRGDQWITVKGTYARPDVASAKSTASLLDTPQTITVIDNVTLQKQNLLTLRDALTTLPGITFGAGEGGGGFGDSINLRGYSANTDITIDGVRDSAQYSRTETFDLQQIEVYNGANSVFNGSGSVGGTINLVSKMPQKRGETVISPSIGTDDYYRATLDSNIRVNDLVAFRLNAVYHRNDVPGRDVERYKRWGVAPAVTIGIDSPTRWTLMGYYQHDDNVPQYGVPYFAALGGKPDGIPYGQYFGYANIDRQKQTIGQLTSIFEHDFNDRVSIRNLTRWESVKQLTIVDPPQAGVFALDGICINGTAPSGYVTLAPGASCKSGSITVPQGSYLPGGPRGNLRQTRNTMLYDQADLRLNFDAGPLHNEAVIGGSASWEHYNVDSGNIFRAADGTNPYLASGLPQIAIGGDPVDYTGPINYVRASRPYGERTDYAAYLFDTTHIGELFEVNFGLRWEHASGDFTTVNYQSDATKPGFETIIADIAQHTSDNLFSYRFGGVFKPTHSVSLYVAYGNSKTPSISTVNGGCTTGTVGTSTFVNFCDFAPEKAKNYEVGAKADLFHHHLQLTAALFRNERLNFRLPSTGLDENGNSVSLQVPGGKSRVDGLALGASGNITKAWTIFANYTYLKSKVIKSLPDQCQADPTGTAACLTLYNGNPEQGGPLQATPKHSGSLFTTYQLPFGLQLGYGLTYEGSFALTTNPSAKLDQTAGVPGSGHYPKSKDWLTHRFFASYPVTPKLTAQVNVQNFTNEHYYTSIRSNGWAIPGATRSATVSLFYNF